jgi:hypothetical protein
MSFSCCTWGDMIDQTWLVDSLPPLLPLDPPLSSILMCMCSVVAAFLRACDGRTTVCPPPVRVMREALSLIARHPEASVRQLLTCTLLPPMAPFLHPDTSHTAGTIRKEESNVGGNLWGKKDSIYRSISMYTGLISLQGRRRTLVDILSGGRQAPMMCGLTLSTVCDAVWQRCRRCVRSCGHSSSPCRTPPMNG